MNYKYNNLKELERLTPIVKKQIKNNKYTFNKSTEAFEFVYLGNIQSIKNEPQHELREIVFETVQPSLKYLDASFCQLEQIVIKNCPNLQTLYLNNNQLKSIRFEGRFEKLDMIVLDRNQLTELDLQASNFPNLKYLYLHENQLVDLSGLAGLFAGQLLDFNVEKNEGLNSPPKDIVEKGKDKCREWFQQVKKYAVEEGNEAKIMIVGEPNAGKTTLMELLFDRNFKVPQPLQASTLGIEIKTNRPFDHPEHQDIKIKAHIWDFGGQDIQYMLHQYFLTEDCVYILLSDGRSGKTRYPYWFHIINLLGKKSPILVLLNRNEKNDTIIPFDEKTYKEIFKELQIINCNEVDFSKLNKTWDAFEEKIAYHLSELPVVKQKIIKPWKLIRDELETLKSKKYVNLSVFEDICKKNGLQENQEIELLRQHFHKIGFALNFDDVNLQDLVFLDPNWITHAIYDVLSDKKIIDKNGEFELENLYQHWQSKKLTETHQQAYTRSECSFLLRLMLKDKLDICYELPNKAGFYVVPMKTPDKRAEYTIDEGIMLHYRFLYKFMPEGMISRLIVRLHEKIWNCKVWLTGVVLEHDTCKAEILQFETTSEGLKYIEIKVSGTIAEKRRAFLKIIREQIEYIHRNTFPYIRYDEMIICNCEACSKSDDPNYYKRSEIDSHIRGGKENIFCTKLEKDVLIKPLLHEVYSDEEFLNKERGNINTAKKDTMEHIHNKRIESLMAQLNQNLDLLNEYENELILTDDPRTKARYKRDIEGLKETIASKTEEVKSLGNSSLTEKYKEVESKADVVYNITVNGNNNQIAQQGNNSSISQNIAIAPQLSAKLDQLQQFILSNPLLQAQTDFDLKANRLKIEDTVKQIKETDIDNIPENRALALLETIEKRLAQLDTSKNEEMESLKKFLIKEVTTAAKLKMSVPLIPGLLQIEYGINAKDARKGVKGFWSMFKKKKD